MACLPPYFLCIFMAKKKKKMITGGTNIKICHIFSMTVQHHYSCNTLLSESISAISFDCILDAEPSFCRHTGHGNHQGNFC